MDNAQYDPTLVPYIVRRGALVRNPFVVIDVGCGMGIDPLWRLFEPYLQAHGIDPQVSEIGRLRRAERNRDVRYHAALVGLPDDDDYHRQRAIDRGRDSPYFHPFARSSGALASKRATEAGGRSLSELNTWSLEELTDDKLSLSEFIRQLGLHDVDFVKTDTDGSDLEVLLSARDAVRETGILGFMVEASYNAPPNDTESSLPNIDKLLRQQGFLVYALSVNRYSRASLPAPFVFDVLAQTTFGQAMWGDIVYLRDAASPDYVEIWGEELSAHKLLKLACLYELFQAPDCAAELLLAHDRTLRELIDVDEALDLLTPPLGGKSVSYQEYIAAFDRDPYQLYPSAGSEEQRSRGPRAAMTRTRRALLRAARRAAVVKSQDVV